MEGESSPTSCTTPAASPRYPPVRTAVAAAPWTPSPSWRPWRWPRSFARPQCPRWGRPARGCSSARSARSPSDTPTASRSTSSRCTTKSSSTVVATGRIDVRLCREFHGGCETFQSFKIICQSATYFCPRSSIKVGFSMAKMLKCLCWAL